MTDSSLAQTLLNNDEFARMMRTRVLVRYWLFVNKSTEYLSADIIALPNAQEMSDFYHVHTNLQLTEGSGSGLSLQFQVLPGMSGLHSLCKTMADRVPSHPFWNGWLKPKEFVGALVYGNDTATQYAHRHFADAENLHFQLYHGLLRERVANYAVRLNEAARLNSLCAPQAKHFKQLADRFSAFVTQTHWRAAGAWRGSLES